MAEMSPYKAYNDQNPSLFSTAAEVAMAPFNPVAHAWMYTHVPGMWSGTKGIKIPFNVTRAKESLSAGAQLFKNKRYLPGMGKFIKGTLGSISPLGGERIFNFGEQIRKSDIAISRLSKGVARQRELLMSLNRQYINEARDAAAATARITNINLDYTGRKPKMLRRVARQKELRKIIEKPTQTLRKFETIQASMAGKQSVISRLSTARGAKVIGKWALRGAKVAAGIGAVMFAWDIAKMVGQPIGRAIVSEYEDVASRFNERFMPELGGRLEMSYLSRGAATERQRAIQAMSKAQITGRSALGQESLYTHQ